MTRARRLLASRAVAFAIFVSAVMAIMLSAAIAQSLSYKAFPQPKITPEQWQSFFAEIKAKPGIENVSRPETPDVVSLADRKEQIMYYFTNGGAAHPALMIEKVVQNGNQVDIETTGYFAGAEEPFARWFRAFQDRAAKIRESFKAGRGGR
jgi:hypothetical protein